MDDQEDSKQSQLVNSDADPPAHTFDRLDMGIVILVVTVAGVVTIIVLNTLGPAVGNIFSNQMVGAI